MKYEKGIHATSDPSGLIVSNAEWANAQEEKEKKQTARAKPINGEESAKWSDVDIANSRVKLARKKTGVSRDLPLWPETIVALEKITRRGKLVFYTSRGNPLIETFLKTEDNGNCKYISKNSITPKFSRLIKKAGLKIPKGTGFYTLRRTAATVAARSGDPFAVQRLLGHADLQMATRYVQDVSKQTDRVIENSRKYIIQGKA